MTVVSGIGWIAGSECGCAGTGERFSYGGDDAAVVQKSLFAHPFRNFGRLDRSSRMTAIAVALALRDAGRSYAPDRKQEIGIVGSGRDGSLPTDLAYFKDYVDCGRTLGRGNLFIYTLPSSPLGEAAIHFGLAGPLLYVSSGASLASAARIAEEMLELGEAETMLAGAVESDEALYLVLSRSAEGGDPARRIPGQAKPLSELIRAFRTLQEK